MGGVVYNKYSMELRYPLTLKPAASIFALAFLAIWTVPEPAEPAARSGTQLSGREVPGRILMKRGG